MNKKEVENFFNLLNVEDISIKFTYEIEENKMIPYLDMMLHIEVIKSLQIIIRNQPQKMEY